MDKVKITQKQADSIKYLDDNLQTVSIIIDHAKQNDNWRNKAAGINGMDMDLLVRALYYGYEVEETPEDKVRKYFTKQREALEKGMTDDTYYAIAKTLNLLNIKIVGVNHD